jgi:catalase
LDKTPTDFFSETEQVAFHLGHLVPGIDVTDDPLLQARLFSYLDTQLTRLGGPNFAQIPINRPHAPVNSMHREGFHQHAIQGGVAPYRPNSLDGGNPFEADEESGAYVETPVTVTAATKVRGAPASYEDHYSQVRLFWRSMSPVEQEHIIRAYTFELGKCYEQAIKERQLRALANVDPVLCEQVALGLGLPAPEATEEFAQVVPSAALSQVGGTWPPDGRMIGIVVDPTGDLESVRTVRTAVQAAGMVPLLIGPHGGMLENGLAVQRTFLTGRSVELDALLLSDRPAPAPDALPNRDAKAGGLSEGVLDPRVALLAQESFRHAKVIGAWGRGVTALELAGVASDEVGVVTGEDATAVLEEVVGLLAGHRVWERFAVSVG